MRVLMDTHVLLWWLDGDRKLPQAMREVIVEPGNEVLVSAASVWEIATKPRIGKLTLDTEVVADLPSTLIGQEFTPLSITAEHAVRAGALPGPHRDPFDRMLAAQAAAEGVALISNDAAFDGLGVVRLWS